MKVLKNFNKISEKLREECIKPFDDGIKTFRMLNGVKNNDPDITERLKVPVFYPDAQIRTYDRIKDPYANEGKGGFVDIGVIELFDLTTEQPTKFRLVVKGQGVGMFTLNAGSVEDVELYEYLCIANENKNFKYRDTSRTPLFEEVTEIDAVEEANTHLDLIVEAASALKKLKPEQKKSLSILLHIDPTLDDRTLTGKLNELAQMKPEDILENIKEVRNTGKKGLGINKRQSELVE